MLAVCSGAPSSGLSASTASGGSLLFIDEGMGGEGPAASIEVERSNEANYNSKPTWLNFTEDELKMPPQNVKRKEAQKAF